MSALSQANSRAHQSFKPSVNPFSSLVLVVKRNIRGGIFSIRFLVIDELSEGIDGVKVFIKLDLLQGITKS